jgi:uncharacterized NAD(P)/FAD-binding protein YdhS
VAPPAANSAACRLESGTPNINEIDGEKTIVDSVRHIAIVGGGFTGTLLAAHIMRLAAEPTRLTIIEKRDQIGRGLAYSTANADHLLNVRAANMSAYPDDPKHFLRWLWARDDPGTPATAIPPGGHAFVSRKLYGTYIQEQFLIAQREAAAHVTCATLADEAVNLTRLPGSRFRLKMADGSVLDVDTVALCIGNFPPALPAVFDPASAQSPFHIRDPWDPEALAAIPREAPVLILGTGLTMVDAVLSLRRSRHDGPIVALSRRGLLPQVHKEARSYPCCIEPGDSPLRIGEVVCRVRREIHAAAANRYDWRSVLDGLRPHLPALWNRLPPEEKSRFLRHVRPYWDVHRHRMAPEIARRVADLQQSGRLSILAGRLRAVRLRPDGIEATIQRRRGGPDRILLPCWLINCSGPVADYRRIGDPLVRSLLDCGHARPDPLGLGLDVTSSAAVVGGDGQVVDGLYALGPVTRGRFWEITAVPELREQCAAMAQLLVGLSRRPALPPAQLRWVGAAVPSCP